MAAILTTIYAEVVKTAAIRNQSRGLTFPEIEKARSELLASSFKWCG